MKRIRVLLADDHPVVRAGLGSMLATQPDLEVVGLAENGAQAVEMALRSRPDVILMDLRMPVLGGREAIRKLSAEGMGRRVLVLTTFDTDADVAPALAAGAAGYLLKETPAEDLFAAIRAVARGERVLSAALASKLGGREAAPALSARELEVLQLLVDGRKNREIAKALFVSEATVKTHLLHVFEKLGVKDRTAAVTRALALGLVHLDTAGGC
jgi:DNA-binding NarL/FixJ family response regulator